jgi:hypothetical protein
MRERDGQIYASGTWWPRTLLDDGAIEVREHLNRLGETVAVMSVVYLASGPHPAWLRWLQDEAAKEKAIMRREAYMDAVVDYAEVEF